VKGRNALNIVIYLWTEYVEKLSFLQDAPIKINPIEKNSVFQQRHRVARILAKLSEFVSENLHNISCKFYCNNWYGSKDAAV